MKIAVTGRGGVGKSTIAGTLARKFASCGHDVVAVDGDPNPNLGVSLGMATDDVEEMRPILNGLIDSGYTHDDPRVPAEELLHRYGTVVTEALTVIATGRIERPTDSCLCCGSHMATREFFARLPADDRVVIADLEAGLNELLWAQPGADDVVLAVSDGSAKGVEVARRMCQIADGMGVRRVIAVANRHAAPEDAARLAEACDAEVRPVPEDSTMGLADARGVAPVDVDESSPAVTAIGDLASYLWHSSPAASTRGATEPEALGG